MKDVSKKEMRNPYLPSLSEIIETVFCAKVIIYGILMQNNIIAGLSIAIIKLPIYLYT